MLRISKTFRKLRLTQPLYQASSNASQSAPKSTASTTNLINNIPVSEYISRRRNVMLDLYVQDQNFDLKQEDIKPQSYNPIGLLPTKYVAILAGNNLNFQNNDIPFPFHQNSNLLYLSGHLEEDSVLVLETTDGTTVESTLFVKDRISDYDSHFEGENFYNHDLNKLADIYGIQECHHLKDLPMFLENKFIQPTQSKSEERKINFFINQNTPRNYKYFTNILRPFLGQMKHLGAENVKILEIDDIVEKFRVIKSENEIDLLIKSSGIASESINMMLNQAKEICLADREAKNSENYNPSDFIWNESQIQAGLKFASANLAGPGINLDLAYPPVIASRDNSCVLHYKKNDAFFSPNSHNLLIDYGIDYFGYKSDITRCLVNVESQEQKEVYTALYTIQTQIIEAIRLAFDKETKGMKEKLTLRELSCWSKKR